MDVRTRITHLKKRWQEVMRNTTKRSLRRVALAVLVVTAPLNVAFVSEKDVEHSGISASPSRVV